MTMMHDDDDDMIMHDRYGGHYVKCTEIMMDDPEIVLDEPRCASISNCPALVVLWKSL